MNIYPINSSGTEPTTTVAKGAKDQADGAMFMKLLVAQLKNQDPLAPQEGTEFVAQLAQFNSLEQLISINDRLSQLINQQKTATTTENTGQN